MKKQKENYFVDKFYLLDSQETSEEISWSCSDSSDYEDHNSSRKFLNITYGKRKKGIRKRKELRNISNLDITIVDPIERDSCAKSPILVGKSKSGIKSPILTPSQPYLPRFMTNKTTHHSPVSYNHINVSKETENLKSPIILLKRESPKTSPKVKKKLFETTLSPNNENISTRSTSPIFISNLHCLDRRKSNIQPLERLFENNQADNCGIRERTKNLNEEHNIPNLKNERIIIANNQPDHSFRLAKRIKNTNEEQGIPILNDMQKKIGPKQPDRSFTKTERSNSPNEEQDNYNLNNEQRNSKFEIIQSSSSDSATNISRTELVARVKSYFDNYFSSQTSNHSISEYETSTPNSKSSEDIENINDITQVKSLSPSLKDAQTTSFGSDTNTIKQKKVKYKRGGLAYRLNALLKKQNANISLWQHERFLAANSNFVIPKEEFLAFRIKNVDFNYNIYSIDAVNEDNESFSIVINSTYVNNNLFETDDVLKVYKPYKIVVCNTNCKIIVNVCKFECRKLN